MVNNAAPSEEALAVMNVSFDTRTAYMHFSDGVYIGNRSDVDRFATSICTCISYVNICLVH